MGAIARLLFVAALAVFVASCGRPPALESDKGSDIEIFPLKTIGPLQANAMLWWVGVKGVRAANAFDCYRVLYPSTDSKGHAIRLSGLLALPHGRAPRALVSFQHGTTSNRDLVPSNLSTDGLAAAILFAGNGYAAVAPDYAGLGVSKGPHPYYVAADTARAVVDMIHAARHIRGVPQGPPFLVGFSEGGYASLAAQRALEKAHEPVLATAAVAGAYNLRSISLPWTMKGSSPQASIYLALWVRGYAARYDHSLETAFTPHYATLVPRLLDTPSAPEDVQKALPANPGELFNPLLRAALDGKSDHWLLHALAENEMGDWRPAAPVRLYYGARDVDVPPAEATTTARLMSARGAPVRAVALGPYDHNQSILVAAPLIVRWLESLSN